MKYLIYVFYAEILINLASIFQTLFTPAAFLGAFSHEPALQPETGIASAANKS